MRILLVEDDALLGDGVRSGLKQGGFAVDWVMDGRQAGLALETGSYEAVVLDLGLPGLGGMEILRRVRSRGDSVPILIVTARDAIDDRVAGLDAGGDDYVVKPFDLSELQARLRALVRRSNQQIEPLIVHGDLTLDPTARTVCHAGLAVELTAREFAILHVLLLNAGRALSRAQIEDRLYGWGEEIESNAVEVFIHHLRRKLSPELIRTVRGVGYMIERASS
ncbi:MAG: response regulator [Rhodocyclaceae bacterium]|jgi:two-component system OmpR family response regulator/two-component system response regulator QseB|nr:response regulator [Rhodocyclaceae bacterium]MCL4757544.1 response regulator [Rhodocyclaceae bacterium]